MHIDIHKHRSALWKQASRKKESCMVKGVTKVN